MAKSRYSKSPNSSLYSLSFYRRIRKYAQYQSRHQRISSLQKIFPDLNLALIHGKTKSEERQKILKNLPQQNSYLVTTPIIEVGIVSPTLPPLLLIRSTFWSLSTSPTSWSGRAGESTKLLLPLQ